MSEIEKLYKNAGISYRVEILDSFPSYEIINPPFTAEKQIALIKWLLQNKRLCIQKAEYSNNFYMDTLSNRLNGVDNKDFEQCLVSLMNNIWQDLKEEEKEQIREILK